MLSRIESYSRREVTLRYFYGHTYVFKETVHFDGYTDLSLIHAREGKIIIVVDGGTYCLWKIGAAFE
jgi:hypothetical protein